MTEKRKTPLLDELEKGPWPSFVKEIKRAAATQPDGRATSSGSSSAPTRTRSATGSTAASSASMGYGGGVIGRYTDLPEEFPDVAAVPHRSASTSRRLVLHLGRPAHSSATSGSKHGSGLHQHARLDRRHHLPRHAPPSPSSPASPSSPTPAGTSAAPAPTCAPRAAASAWRAASGPATTPWRSATTSPRTYQDELHRPSFPYKFKIKIAGCPNDCVASIARSDLSDHRAPGRTTSRSTRRRCASLRQGRHGHPERGLRHAARPAA